MSRRILVVTAQGEVRYLGSESEAVRVLTIQPTGARGATGPAGADGGTSDVKSASFTAANDKQYTVVATLTVTDPSPVEGKGFEVFLRNGTATVGGTAYTRSGTTIRRVFHSGAWTNTLYVFPIVSADISDATSAATANTVVRRDASGGAAFDDLTAATVVFTEFLQSTAANAYIGTDGASAYIATAGTNSPIFTLAADSPIYTTASNSNIETLHASASVRSYNFAALDVTEGASLRNSAGTAILTWGATAGNISITVNTTSTGHFFSNPSTSEAGHFLTKNGTTPTLAAGRSAWFSNASGVPQFKNGTGSAVTLLYDGSALGTPSSGTLTNCTGLPVSTGISGFGANVAAFLETPTSANLAAALTDETGSGAAVFQDDPELYNAGLNGDVAFDFSSISYGPGSLPLHQAALGLTTLATTTPGTGVATALAVNVGTAGAFVVNGGALGTPASGTLTSCTGLPISTGVSGLGTGVATLLTGTPSGTGGPVGTTSPTISNPTASTASTSSAALLVSGPTSGVDTLRIQGTTTASYSSIGFIDSGGTQRGSFGYSGTTAGSFANTTFVNAAGGVPLTLGTNSVERIRIATSGGVSIGTTTDAGATNLRVAGTLTTGAPASTTARPMKFGSVTTITDAAMVALGFTSQQKVEINAVDYWIPMKTSAWT